MDEIDRRAEAVRGFNRFYTKQIGVLGSGLLQSPFSLTEVRVLYELAHRDALTARTLAAELGLDPGYLSRMLTRFEKRGFLAREQSADDARRRHLRLTPAGQRAFAPLNRRAHDDIVAMLNRLRRDRQLRLLNAMSEIRTLLDPAPAHSPPQAFVLRPPRPGDLGWVVRAHGAMYAAEYRYDITFEALVAGIVADFVKHFDPRRDGCWIAERDGEPVGSIFLVRKTRTVAKLRLFLIDPAARGAGLGARLIDECIRFARQAGYRKIVLWTQSDLLAARKLYKRAGFRRTGSERHHSFGHDLVAETWELAL